METLIEQKKDEVFDNYICPICLDLLFNPIKTVCNHLFCQYCLNKFSQIQHNKECPSCRRKNFIPQIQIIEDKLQKEIKNLFPDQIIKRKEQLELQIKEDLSKIELIIKYGNKIEFVQTENSNQYRWIVFVEIENLPQNFQLNQIIQSVNFQLHPTFNPQQVKINKPPYQITRLGWGTFNIPISIQWNPKFQIPDTFLDHYLSFDEGGNSSNHVAFLNLNKIQNK